MTITFISFWQALVWMLAALLALSLYLWKVRPMLADRPEFREFYALADTRWQRLYAWLKIRWDLSVGAAIMVLPSLWNGILDAIIWLSINLADVLPALAGLDLSALLLPPRWEAAIRIAAAILPLFREWLIKKNDE